MMGRDIKLTTGCKKEYRYKLLFEITHTDPEKYGEYENMIDDPWQQFGTLLQWAKTGKEGITDVHLYDLSYPVEREILWQDVPIKHRLKCVDREGIELLVLLLLAKRENDGLKRRPYKALRHLRFEISKLLIKLDLGE